MQAPSSSSDVDLLFVALHQANLQCFQKKSIRYPMSRDLYFYDQFTRVSHLGGIARHKRHPEDLNQALHHVRVALAAEDGERAKTETPGTQFNPTPSPVKQQIIKPPNEGLLRTIQRKLNAPIIPDILFKELDSILLRFDDKSKTSTSSSTTTTPQIPSSIPPKSGQTTLPEEDEQENDLMTIQDAEDEDELIFAHNSTPKVSLPGSLILALHSTWSDLIENTEYRYKTWQTKAGEDFWRRHIEHKRVEHINTENRRSMGGGKQSNRRRIGSRTSITSIGNLSRQQQSLIANTQIRSNRPSSRVSFISATNISQLENLRLLKPIQQGSSESLTESVKSGIHVEFKLSTQIDETKQEQQSQTQSINNQRGVSIDVRKPSVDVHEDVIVLIQARCKRLLAEMKEKRLATGINEHSKMCKIWFYGENQHIRNKSNILTLNESARKQRSKFIFSLLRREIPEKYHLEITIPENKHKSLLETIDGSIQIYYPSGRLAVLRLNSPNSYTLFFDDIDNPEQQFLGLVTSSGSVFVMQPTLHARFTTDNQRERAYLCDGKTGIIEKQIQYHLTNVVNQSIISNDDDDILPPLFENTVQFQLNSSMQLEYHNPTNIRFAFASQKEEYKFQLGTHLPSQTTTSHEVTNHLTKKYLIDKKNPSKSKLSTVVSNSTTSNEISVQISDKQQVQVERLLDGQVNIRELPMIKELTLIRKRIRHLCNNWLKECRIALGVMDIDSYCLPEWSSRSTQLFAPILPTHQSKSAKSPRHVPISSKHDSITTNEFLQPSEREQIIRRFSARKPDANVIADTITQFIPRSNSAKVIKRTLSPKKTLSPKLLPSIKTQRTPPTGLDESLSPRVIIPLDLPFACPNLIRQRSMQDGPISTLLYDTCICRSDQVPLIRDLEFDTFMQLTSHINAKQLVVVGIINSNLRQIENEENDQSNELHQILHTLHYHLNYGRSQICSCRLSTNDDYRCLIYDLAEATKQSSLYGPLLVRRHHVQPGFVLIYQHGQLIFGDSIFNGYGKNVQDLKKQLNHMREQQIQQTALPEEFKFISDHQRNNTRVLKSI